MAMNVSRIRKQVQKAIEVAPFSLQLKRDERESDGRGGTLSTGNVIDVFEGTCLFDNSGDGPFSLVQSDGGREKEQAGPYLIVVYEDNVDIQLGDYFEYGGSRYEVAKVTNVLALNIYWQIKLEETKL